MEDSPASTPAPRAFRWSDHRENYAKWGTPLGIALSRIGWSQYKLGKECNIRQTQISQIVRGHQPCSAEMAVRIERGTRGVITRLELRRDLFGPLY